MREILIGFLIVLLVIMAYLMIFKGLELGDFKVLSASQIVEENDRLTKEISDTEVLMNSEYPTKTEELDTSVSKYREMFSKIQGLYSKYAQKSSYINTEYIESCDKITEFLKEDGFNVIDTPYGKIQKILYVFFVLPFIFLKIRKGNIVIQYPTGKPKILKAVIFGAKKLSGAKLIFVIHDIYSKTVLQHKPVYFLSSFQED